MCSPVALVSDTSPGRAKRWEDSVVILGGSASDPHAKILIVGDEEHLPYVRAEKAVMCVAWHTTGYGTSRMSADGRTHEPRWRSGVSGIPGVLGASRTPGAPEGPWGP